MTEPFDEGDIEAPRDPEAELEREQGDDEQLTELDAYERYIEDPPDDDVDINEYAEGGETGISEWVGMEARPRDLRVPEDEETGFHETDRP